MDIYGPLAQALVDTGSTGTVVNGYIWTTGTGISGYGVHWYSRQQIYMDHWHRN